MRKVNRRVISTDANGHELRVGDNVKEVDGEVSSLLLPGVDWLTRALQNRRGVVLHIHQAFYAFLHNRDITQNGGIFVTRCRSLEPIAPKGGTKAAVDLSKMNPALLNSQGGAPSMSRGPRDRLVGVNVVIVKGPQKGYLGTIKDVNGDHCRVELNTTNKIVTVEKLKLRRRGCVVPTTPVDLSAHAWPLDQTERFTH
jgi:transcription elongation factor SPT5